MKELTKRVLFAVPAAAFFLYVTWLGGFYFTGLVAVIMLFVQREMGMIMDKAGYKTDDYFPYSFGLLILLTPYLPHDFILFLAILLLFLAVQIFKSGERGLSEMIPTFFNGIYAPAGLLCLLLIRQTGAGETGFMLTLILLLMVWGNDIFAYFGGKAFGRHLMAPKISPKKTWEGFFFGILGAVVGMLLVHLAVPLRFPATLLYLLPSALFVSAFGPLGDLTESRLKRAADVKDSSDILPGHGGFFDRFDALLLAAPAFYIYLELLEILDYASF